MIILRLDFAHHRHYLCLVDMVDVNRRVSNMSAYYAPNGLPYLYDPFNQELVEISYAPTEQTENLQPAASPISRTIKSATAVNFFFICTSSLIYK